MIKNLLFDMGGVILPMNDIEIPIERYARIGLQREDALRLFGLYGQQGIFRDAESGILSPDEFLEAYRQLTGYAATFAEMQWAWLGFVQDVPPQRLEWLTQLRNEGYHVALVSNTNPFIQHYCESSAFSPQGRPIGDFFDVLYYSYELGACKPDPLAFRRVLERGTYKPEECLFLDDALHNVEAARAQGMQALHVPDNQDWMLSLREYLSRP